jgi:hypothetical protein
VESDDRSAQQQAGQAVKTASSTGAGYGTAASGISSSLVPTLQNDVNNPTGYSPTETNKMLVAGEQGAGGAAAGVTGAAGLDAARTRNSGALSSVLDQAARRKGQTLSGNALGVENKSADLAQKKRASALGGLEGLYGTDVGAQLKAMGLQSQDINSEINAGNSGWLQQGEGLFGTLSKAGLGAANAAGFG